VKYIEVRELTKESFKPFGCLVEVPEKEPDITRGNLEWWGNLYDLSFSDTSSLGFLRIIRNHFRVDYLERHVKAPEIFIPIRGTGIMPFAPASLAEESKAVPDETALTAFLLDGTKGLVVDPGVWHSPGIALSDALDFILTVRKDTSDDIDIKKIAERRILL
jgi:ureidoglycolate lyase